MNEIFKTQNLQSVGFKNPRDILSAKNTSTENEQYAKNLRKKIYKNSSN